MRVDPHTQIQIGQAAFGEFSPTRAIGPCTWPHFDLLVVHEGRIDFVIDGNPEQLEAGQALLVFPNTPFSGTALEPTRISVQHVGIPTNDGARLPAVYRHFAGMSSGYQLAVLPPAVLEHDIPRAVELELQASTDDVLCCQVALMSLQLSAFLTTREHALTSTTARRLAPAVTYVSQHLDERILLSDLAACCGLSVSHFRAEFTTVFGASPGLYVRHARLDKAAGLLRSTETPIKDIAAQVGYYHLKNFYRMFKHHYGITPGDYRDEKSTVG